MLSGRNTIILDSILDETVSRPREATFVAARHDGRAAATLCLSALLFMRPSQRDRGAGENVPLKRKSDF